MDNNHLFTPPEEAVAEIHTRRKNPDLVKEVMVFLNHDIPEHFDSASPILYFARHIATPSFETLRFIEVTKPFNLPIVIGQDIKDKFVSNNCLKRSLGKMSVVKGVTRKNDEITECFTIIDFDSAQGKPLHTIETIFGESIVDLHVSLLKEICPPEVITADESAWVNRNDRGNLLEHYKKFLSLFIVHGIMFETYIADDYEFITKVLNPAFSFVEKKFGYKPLICELLDPELESERNWDAYPSVVYPYLKKRFDDRNKTDLP